MKVVRGGEDLVFTFYFALLQGCTHLGMSTSVLLRINYDRPFLQREKLSALALTIRVTYLFTNLKRGVVVLCTLLLLTIIWSYEFTVLLWYGFDLACGCAGTHTKQARNEYTSKNNRHQIRCLEFWWVLVRAGVRVRVRVRIRTRARTCLLYTSDAADE